MQRYEDVDTHREIMSDSSASAPAPAPAPTVRPHSAAVQEPTLGMLLRSAARKRLPRQFYRLLHLAIPVALQFAEFGWWRSAAWMAVISATGAWGLCEHRVVEADAMGWKRPWS